jgi:hypothetical protein
MHNQRRLNRYTQLQHAALALRLATDNFKAGTIDYTAVFVAEQFLVQQQNAYAQAQGDIAPGLIQVYRALGGGWELRLAEQAAAAEGMGGTAVPCNPAPAAGPGMAAPHLSSTLAGAGAAEAFASGRTDELERPVAPARPRTSEFATAHPPNERANP